MDEVYYSEINWDNIIISDANIQPNAHKRHRDRNSKILDKYNTKSMYAYIQNDIKIIKSYVKANKNELLNNLIQFIISDLSKIVSSYLIVELNFEIYPKFEYFSQYWYEIWKYYVVWFKVNNKQFGFHYGFPYKSDLTIYFNGMDKELENDCRYIANNHIKYLLEHRKFSKNPFSL